MFRNLLFAAVLAALCAGLAMSLMQAVRLTPLILAAETYEGDAVAEPGEHAAMPEHDAGQWTPADGFERTAYTALSTLLMAAGYALVLGAVSTLFAIPITGANALGWAAAGFVVFSLAPSFGLAPNLPGMPVAGTLARQLWWVGVALATHHLQPDDAALHLHHGLVDACARGLGRDHRGRGRPHPIRHSSVRPRHPKPHATSVFVPPCLACAR